MDDASMGDPQMDGKDRDIVELVRSVEDDDRRRLEPPPELWSRISADAFGATEVAAPATRVGVLQWLAVAAVVVVVAGLGIARMVGPAVDASAVLTAADLEQGIPGVEVRAEVIDGGELELQFVAGALPDADGFYEVWMIRPDLSGMFSLGVVGEDGSFRIPEGLDLREYPIVDISREPLDGEPAHSGVSVLRGTLST